PPLRIELPLAEIRQSERVQKEKQVPLFEDLPDTPLPPLKLLDEARAGGEQVTPETLEFTSRLIEKKLSDFGVAVKVIAAYTGSGKSVALNAMILSLLYKSELRHVRLILVDPKMLELSVYQHIPHLLTPVVTDMKQAVNALGWCVAEMDRRYKLMNWLGVRNLSGFNHKVAEAGKHGRGLEDPVTHESGNPQPLQHLPYIVVVIDELAALLA